MSDLPAWIASLQLARVEGGETALEALAQLPGERRHDVLTAGERFAAGGATLAQAFLLRAPAARRALDQRAFERWSDLGFALAERTLGNREAAVAYFRADAEALAGVPRPLVDLWLELAARVQALSRRLAALFVASSAAAVSELGDDAPERLRAFAEGALELARTGGWRGEFLAAAFLSGGATSLRVLSAGELRRFLVLGLALQVGRDLEQNYFRSLPEGFERLTEADRAVVFELCLTAADASPKIAKELFERVPEVVAGFPPVERTPLLEALRAAAREAEAVLRLTPLLGAIVRSLGAAERRPLLVRAAELGARQPGCVVPLLRSLPRAREDVDLAGLLRWIDRGEDVARENPAAARAYFALESRTGVARLRDDSASVRLEDVERVLRSLARMISARSVGVRAGGGGSLRPFLDLESLEEGELALPDVVRLFDTWEENFRLLKLVTVNAAGRFLHGTFELSLGDVWKRLPEPLASTVSASIPGDTLTDLLNALPDGDPLIAIFTACEGARIDARLRSEYRGYRASLVAVASKLLAGATRGATADTVLFLLGAGVPVERLANSNAELPLELLELLSSALLSPEARVEDALAAAIQLRERLVDSLDLAGFGPQTTYDELVFEKLSGESWVEPEPEADEDRGSGANEIVHLEPKAVEESDRDERGTPLGAEELRRLLEAGAILKVGRGGDSESAGIFATGIWLPKAPNGEADAGAGALGDAAPKRTGAKAGVEFEYDEWDHQIGDYRDDWCLLREIGLGGDSGEFFQQALVRHADLLPEVRRQFQRIRPERYQRIRGLEDGEDFDWNAVVDARVELRQRRSPSTRLYVARRREERDVATLFLLDMSASTDEPLPAGPGEPAPARPAAGRPRRIIDVTKEALVMMAEALHEIGDQYAIYGFSGEGRRNVEFYPVKRFNEGLTAVVRGRIGGIEPRRSTRMGAALRHSIAKMGNVAARSKHVLLLSDGFPQDFDYGADRRSNAYGIHDTMKALQECQAAGITPFCITVDKTGHDYLRQMCETSRYMVIDEVDRLPAELPKIYERWVHA